MTGEKTWCDECGRMKEKANHWHQVGVINWSDSSITVELGALGAREVPESSYKIHDLCGEQCFYKHLAKLLKLNPVAEGEQQ